MKKRNLFQVIAIATIWFYCSATVFAGQVITDAEKNWAQKVLKQEADLGSAGKATSVAVLNYHNMSGDKRYTPLQKGLALMLINDLSELDGLNIIERTKIQALLNAMEIGTTGLFDESVAPSIGNILKVSSVVSGKIGQGGIDIVQIFTDVFDVDSDRSKRLASATGEFRAFLDLEKKVLFSILEQLHYPLTKKERKRLTAPLSISAAAMLKFFQGIDSSDQEKYKEAAQLYSEALAADPGLKIAHDCLIELRDLGLISDFKIPLLQEATVVPAEEGSSTLTYLGIGAGVVALAAGAFALGGSSSGSDSSSSTSSGDDTAPTVRTNHSSAINCVNDTVIFSFDQSMNQSAGYISISGAVGDVGQQWVNGTYQVSFSGTSSQCSSVAEQTINMELSNFRSAEGADLNGPLVFSFHY